MEGRASGAVKGLAPGPRVMLAADLAADRGEDLGLGLLLLVPFGFQIPGRIAKGEERKAASGCVMVAFRMGSDSHQKWGTSFSV